jgi:predicted nuclease of predicted toxin-antitoxin system
MFLANENFPRPSTIILRNNGFQVKSIQEEFAGINDEEVIRIAIELNLIILTFDSDYGELIFKYAKQNPPSVIFFREKGNSPDFAGTSLLTLLTKSSINFLDSFTVVEKNNLRQRFYKK